MSKSQWLQRSVAVIVMSGQLSSCTGWRAESLSPVDVIEDQHTGEIRVQRGDGRSEVLYRPEVNGDSLVGRMAALVLGIGALLGVLIGLGSMQGPLDNWGQ